jgi:hypothetical protein
MARSGTGVVRGAGAAVVSLLCTGAKAPDVLVPGDVALSYQVPSPGMPHQCPNEEAFRSRMADMYDLMEPMVPAGAPASATVRVVVEQARVNFPLYVATLSVLEADGTVRGSSTELDDDCNALVWQVSRRVRMLMGTWPAPRPPPPPVAPCPAAGGAMITAEMCKAFPPVAPCPAAGGAVITAELCKAFPLVAPCPAAHGAPMTVEMCNGIRAVLQPMDPTFGLIVGGALSFGFTADVGPGLFLAGEAHWRRKEDWGFHLALEPRFFFPTKAGVTTSGDVLDVSLLDFAVVPCARYKWALGCAFVDAGVTFGTGPAVSGPEDEDRGLRPLFMLGMGPRLAVDVPITDHVGVRAFADLRFSPLPPTGHKQNGVTIIWQHPPVSGFVGLGVSFR